MPSPQADPKKKLIDNLRAAGATDSEIDTMVRKTFGTSAAEASRPAQVPGPSIKAPSGGGVRSRLSNLVGGTGGPSTLEALAEIGAQTLRQASLSRKAKAKNPKAKAKKRKR